MFEDYQTWINKATANLGEQRPGNMKKCIPWHTVDLSGYPFYTPF